MEKISNILLLGSDKHIYFFKPILKII